MVNTLKNVLGSYIHNVILQEYALYVYIIQEKYRFLQHGQFRWGGLKVSNYDSFVISSFLARFEQLKPGQGWDTNTIHSLYFYLHYCLISYLKSLGLRNFYSPAQPFTCMSVQRSYHNIHCNHSLGCGDVCQTAWLQSLLSDYIVGTST